jgi:cytochrome d ubiquinol oxidase subunit II
MQTTFWPILLGVFLAGYLALEGADFGAAMLLPVFGRHDQHSRDGVIRAIAPLFLGNEVWLVAAIGVVQGAFPGLDGTVLSRLYPVFVVLLVAWLTRDAGLWFRSHGGVEWRWRWDCTIAVASVLLAAGWGVVLANLALGTVTAANPALTGLAPSDQGFGLVPMLCGLLLAGFCALRGSLFLNRRLSEPAAERANLIARRLSLPVAGLTIITGAVLAFTDPPGRHWPLWLLGSLLVMAALATRSRPAGLPLTALAIAASVPLTALAGLPYLPTANAATLAALTPLVIAVLPIIVACQVGLWWLCRGPVESRSWSYF